MMGRAQLHVPLPIAVVGCDFRVASTSWRNRLILADDERSELAAKLANSGGVTGFVVLQTCNRVEWIISSDRPQWAADLAAAQMLQRLQSGDFQGRSGPRPYVHVGEAAAAHLVAVALGLESFVRGEREIAGQLNRAFSGARKAKLASPELNALQTVLGRVVKRVQRLTDFGARARGVHGLAIEFLLKKTSESGVQRPRLAVAGMGEIGKKTVELGRSVYRLEVVALNRTISDPANTDWRPLNDLPAVVADVDALIVATGAPHAIVSAETLRGAPDALVVVDIGTPDQVNLDDGAIKRFGLDDLLVGTAGSDDDLDAVLAFAEDAVAEYRMALRKREVAGLLRATQDHYDRLIYGSIPNVIDGRCDPTVASELRAVIRQYAREVVHEIERAVGGDA